MSIIWHFGPFSQKDNRPHGSSILQEDILLEYDLKKVQGLSDLLFKVLLLTLKTSPTTIN